MRSSTGSPLPQGLVFSDLHLFAPRSDGATVFERLQPQLANRRTLVLNGDTFDFRWSKFPNHETSTRAALEWLNELLRKNPDCRVHFLSGNHDCLDSFTRNLALLAKAQPRFHWHDTWLRLGQALFLHGDCAQYPMDAAGLDRYRAVWRRDRRRGRLASGAYIAADRLGLTNLAHRWAFPRGRTLTRIVHYLDSVWPQWRREIRHCYFGHTHLPFSGVVFQGIHFHNTGSAIRGMSFNPCTFD